MFDLSGFIESFGAYNLILGEIERNCADRVNDWSPLTGDLTITIGFSTDLDEWVGVDKMDGKVAFASSSGPWDGVVMVLDSGFEIRKGVLDVWGTLELKVDK
jgi:hypothetical protein